MCLMGTWEDQDSKWEILSELCSDKIIQPAREARGPEGPARWER